MIERCYSPHYKRFRDYGGRGIRVCDEWRSNYEFFLRDVGPAPTSDHQLDRINNDGNYEPGNVRWATVTEQQRNRRSNVYVESGGERMTIAAWSDRTGIPAKTISRRLREGWDATQAVTLPTFGSGYTRKASGR